MSTKHTITLSDGTVAELTESTSGYRGHQILCIGVNYTPAKPAPDLLDPNHMGVGGKRFRILQAVTREFPSGTRSRDALLDEWNIPHGDRAAIVKALDA